MTTDIKSAKSARFSTRTMTMTAILSVIAFVLAFLEIPVPVIAPSFVKLDLSDFPALIGAFAFGPMVGVVIELIKNGLQLFSSSTGGVGELANFFIGSSFVFTAGLIYKLNKTKKTAWLSCIAGSLVMALAGVFMNYFVLVPLFEKFMSINAILASFKYMPFIKTKFDMCLYSIAPFNFLKGMLIGVFTMLIYKKLAPILKGRN